MTDSAVNDANSLQQFGAVFNYATIGILITDHKGTIVNFNKYAETQFGYTSDEVYGEKVEMLIPREYRSSHINERRHFHQQPEPRRMGEGRDLFGLKKDGRTFPVEVSLSPYTVNGEIRVIAFVIDITVRKESEAVVLQQKKALERITAEIKQLNVQLEQKVEARTQMLRETMAELERSREELSEALENEKHIGELKSRFVTLASHEFRTPLSTILSSAFLLEKYNDMDAAGQRTKHIQRIKSSVLGLKGILDDFLSMGKLEEGRIQSTRQELSAAEIGELIRNILTDMEQLLKEGQHITFEFDIGVGITTDAEIIKNILINLVSNAIKFSGEGTTISILCRATEKELSVAVKDQGIGISREDLKHLSDRFFRAGNAAHVQGTGLGLHIISKYLELLNGRMEIQSVLNEGSCFTIYLPRI
ncbi:PAS domain-containing sensor histidine kinase [Compostibacter hankyongensis]